MDFFSSLLAAFSLAGIAELGDKSQIVCMVLASRHPRWPVLIGASTALVLLSALAVTVGASVTTWIPEKAIGALITILFAAFGIISLLGNVDVKPASEVKLIGSSALLTAFILLLVAEIGDKTQLATAGLAMHLKPLPVWIGASLALIGISALGVWVGSSLLSRLPKTVLSRASGLLFLGFAAVALWRTLSTI